MKKLTKAALTRLTKKALNGDADAQFVLANVYCYAAADGVTRDRIKAQKKLLFKVIHKHYFLLAMLYYGAKVLLQIVQEL